MAQKVEVILYDDIDGGEADETVQFAIDGFSYEIDLSRNNSDALRELLRPYLEVSRRVRHDGDKAQPKRSTVGPSNATIRAWARSQPDIDIKDRGAVPGWVKQRWTAAHA